jgi:hypothetical protein
MKRQQTSSSALSARSRLNAHFHFMMRPSNSPGWTPSFRESQAWSPHQAFLNYADAHAHVLGGPG